MKKTLLTLFCLVAMVFAAKAETYTHTFKSGELTTTGGTITLSDIAWNATGAAYIGWDKNGKGIQIGSKNTPNTDTYTLSTSAFAGCKINSITVNSSIAASGDAKLTVTVGSETSDEKALETVAKDYSFDFAGAMGDIAISWKASQRAYYVKSITIEYTPDASMVTVPAPVFKTPLGIYADEVLVTTDVDLANPNSVFYYTTDGTEPSYEEYVNSTGTTKSNRTYQVYEKLTETATIKAMAVIVDGDAVFKSIVAEATYVVSRTMPYINASSITSGNKYAMVAADSAACYYYEDKAYGYLPTKTATAANDRYIETVECAGFTFTATDGGYTIQDALGRYVYHSGTYTSFNYATEKPSTGAVWSVAIDNDGNATIACDGYTIHYSIEHGTYGCYPADKITENHVLPKLYMQREYPTFTIVPEESSYIDKLEKVTITCPEGIRNADLSAVATRFDSNVNKDVSTELVCEYIDENTIQLTATTPITTTNNTNLQINITGDIMLDPEGMEMPIPTKSKYGVRTLVSYTLIGNAEAATITEVSPENGAVVEELSHFIFTFSYFAGHTDDASIQPRLYAEGKEWTYALERTTNNSNGGMIEMEQAALKTTEPLLGNGTYYLEIPDGYFVDGNGKSVKGMTLKYTVKNDGDLIAGIEDIVPESTKGWTVYNLQGVKILETTDAQRVNVLPAGIYIVNGIKTYIK
ncbi:MAG: hypothetical protein IKU76_03260 [Bacteroidaceae bacterium]|nr:hypothetical protein [Bacteroidaceae bacterium]